MNNMAHITKGSFNITLPPLPNKCYYCKQAELCCLTEINLENLCVWMHNEEPLLLLSQYCAHLKGKIDGNLLIMCYSVGNIKYNKNIFELPSGDFSMANELRNNNKNIKHSISNKYINVTFDMSKCILYDDLKKLTDYEKTLLLELKPNGEFIFDTEDGTQLIIPIKFHKKNQL